MGTSSSNGGPMGKSPLLPTWAQDIPIDTGEEQEKDTNQDESSKPKIESSDEINKTEKERVTSSNENGDAKKVITDTSVITDSWGTTKRALSRGIKYGGKSGFRKASKQYLKSLKGSKNANAASRRGAIVGGNYVNFLSGVSSVGLEQTLRDYNLTDCIGKSSDEVFARIVDAIAPTGTTSDDAIARNALITAMEKLWEKNLESENNSSDFNTLSEDAVKDSIIEFTGAYIFQKWIFEAGIGLEKSGMSEDKIVDRENEVRQFILDEVKMNLPDDLVINLDYREGKGKEIIDEILELAYSILE